MRTGVKGAISVRKWLNLIDDPTSPFHERLKAIYGSGDRISEPTAVCRKTLEAFTRIFGPDREVIISRSTGRINLMGMHIDHRGGAVNPISVKEMFCVIEARDDDVVDCRSVEEDQFPPESFSISRCIPENKIVDWDAWCHDEFEKRRADSSITWSNYVRAPVLYLQHLNTEGNGKFAPPLRGMNLMAYSNIPRSGGLSSSSAVVVATANAFIHINNLSIDPTAFVDLCGYGEWYVGTRGGSGDHAAIQFGKPNSILHMKSFPVTVESAPFPPDCRVVLANSMVESNKRAGSRNIFNDRVASYNFGFMALQKTFPEFSDKLAHLRDVNPEHLGLAEGDIYKMLRSIPETADRQGVLELLRDREAEVQNIFRSHDPPPQGYRMRRVCMYGVAECLRSNIAFRWLEEGNVEGFGRLLSLSHDGDRVSRAEDGGRVPVENNYSDDTIDRLVADLQSDDHARADLARLHMQPGGYHVSVPEADELVDIALSAPGTLGARMVGAGLGGSVAAIVDDQNADKLVKKLKNRFYEPRGVPAQVEIVFPVGGAGIIEA